MLATVTAAPLGSAPDLVIVDLDVADVVVDCQTLAASGEVRATVRNAGDAATGAAFSVVFFDDVDGSGGLDAGDTVLAEATAGPLAPGEEAMVAAPVSGSPRFVNAPIHVVADADGVIAESDETNNGTNSGLACEFAPVPGTFDPVIEWAWTSSPVMGSSLNVMMTPAVVDLDGDVIPEVIFGSTSSTGGGLVEIGVLRALRGTDGAEVFTVTDPTLFVSTTCSVAVGDIDGDTRPEIIACDTTGARLIAFEHDGTFKWRSPMLEAVNWGGPSIADLDADGTPEIVIGRQVLNSPDGSVRWTGTGGRASQGNIGPIPLVADVDLDGEPEVVAGNTVYSALGAIEWQSGDPDGHNALADFDDDGFPEIVLVTNGTVRLREHDGALKWGPVAIPGRGAGGPPTIADYDGDGEVEIGVAGATRYVVFETDGTVKWQAVTQDGSSNRTGSSVFDFDGDGSAEVVYRDELFLRVYRGTDGAVLFQTPMSSCTWHEYVLVADVDADGNAEIVAVANNNCAFGPQRGVYVFGDLNDTWVATRRVWNQHAYHITNVGEDGSIPAVEPNNWETFNNYRQNVQTEGSPLAAPDLTASLISSDSGPCPDAVGLVARIGNGGSNVVAPPVDVAFYDGDPGAGGVLLGVAQTTLALEPGDFEDVVLAVAPALEGTHLICVIADDDGLGAGTTSECNEKNNGCCAELTVFCCEPVADPDMKTQGFWKRQCQGPHPSGEHDNLPFYVDCVSATATFEGVADVAALCDRLHPSPPNDKCEQAEAQFMALMLNLCSGRVAECNCVDLANLELETVGEVVEFIDGLLSSPDRTFWDCVIAQSIADHLNNGVGLVDCP
jgi:hypothetical protein